MGAVHLRTPGSRGGGQMGFEEGPFGVGEVGLVCFSLREMAIWGMRGMSWLASVK
jgi:hypothetical protein